MDKKPLVGPSFCMVLLFFGMAFMPVTGLAASGKLALKNWENSDGTVKVAVMRLGYKLSTFFQEPCEHYRFYYEAIDDFSKIQAITIRAQVTAAGKGQDAYITYSPLVAEPGKWGWDVTGCGYWNQFFKSASGAYVSEDVAKGYFKAGIGLQKLEVVKIDTDQFVSDDTDYSRFLKYVGQVYPVASYLNGNAAAAHSPVDKQLPKTFAGLPNKNFWQQRNIYPEQARAYSLPEGMATRGSCNNYLSLIQWTYGGYEHVALRMPAGDHYVDKKQVHLGLTYRGLTGQGDHVSMRHIGSHRFSTTLSKGQGFVLVDRMKNPSNKPLKVTAVMDCEKGEAVVLDPLADPAKKDPLDVALAATQDEHFKLVEVKQGQDKAAVYEGYNQAREREKQADATRRLARERAAQARKE